MIATYGANDICWSKSKKFFHYKKTVYDVNLGIPLLKLYGSRDGCYLGRYDLRRRPSAKLTSDIVSFLEHFHLPDGSFVIATAGLPRKSENQLPS
jgi:hypothetical protein